MTQRRQKLELTWLGKEQRPRLEPRILLEDPARSYHAPHRVSDTDLFDNRLIFGDNLLALKALEYEFTGKIKCIYLDPPYNTGSAFDRYDDGIEHSLWLSLIRDRLELCKSLLSEHGSIWVSIDDREQAYLRVVMDEIFGRQCFIACNVWQKRYSRENREAIGDAHEYILVYAKEPASFKERRNFLPLQEKQQKIYRNPDNDPRGDWQSVSLLAQGYRPNQMYEIIAPSGARHTPPSGNCWKLIREEYEKLVTDNRIYFGQDGNGVPRRKYFLNEAKGLVPWTWWPHEDVGHTGEAKQEVNTLFGAQISFDTAKPERLIQQVLMIATNPGDLVLDSFAGSGTTGAVAHKMGRRWIMVELGEHCHTHIIPRLHKVIDGQDPGGITKAMAWQGGGGFRYFKLAPSLLDKDRWGNWVINKEYNAAMLAEALCKLEGFTYAPSATIYWQQGHSTERDFIYVTTQTLTHEQLQALNEEVGSERTLLVLCAAYRAAADLEQAYPNLTLKKIPNAVISRCEYGKDDYSLQVANLPAAPLVEPLVEEALGTTLEAESDVPQLSLFGGEANSA
ncbi:MAG: site-specific DNA-methyltransferase [Caldilineaceae bacterium]|nr:site-specific DNA-methyltransferase [Caldilineaceae bacterium]